MSTQKSQKFKGFSVDLAFLLLSAKRQLVKRKIYLFVYLLALNTVEYFDKSTV